MVPDTPHPARPPWHALDAGPRQHRDARSPVPAILVVLAGILLAVLLGLLVGARVGSLTIAGTLAVAGTWRAVAPGGPAGLAIRSRGFDVFLCWSAATVVAVLALTAPGV
ncbi:MULTISPECIES: DUF3017 domain-containing protein [Isoptericola]|uniref:DUF3017 domain-containing protein n=1 Tax=Isoptericola sediminis TaxID=2733572 RepID=A0A849JW27_9MICO|nr:MULTISPECIES: DUF3017 domain-containing protein [unclassified Isoptericola]MDO8146939.1 DUF3017 domain-containing protein [Isoptericola sp. b515]MDO8150746.1 DUF3017 domain-containing protein [Isoptericola sp. b408]NNU26804.1 DUF3017 domain-containing protein [Isoptericola sediminis]